jgi:hypothetical protein
MIAIAPGSWQSFGKIHGGKWGDLMRRFASFGETRLRETAADDMRFLGAVEFGVEPLKGT